MTATKSLLKKGVKVAVKNLSKKRGFCKVIP